MQFNRHWGLEWYIWEFGETDGNKLTLVVGLVKKKNIVCF